MDKIIMQLDPNTELLSQSTPLKSLLHHPIPFPPYQSKLVKHSEAIATLTELLKGFEKREFTVTPFNYGLEVSINYSKGEFVSMILKGTGELGESIDPAIASLLAPPKSGSKKEVTVHALITVQDVREFRNGLNKYDVPAFLKQRLLEGFAPYEDKKIVCRILRLYIDGVSTNIDEAWATMRLFAITGLADDYNHTRALELASTILSYDPHYLLPQRGIVIADASPSDPEAFAELHLLFDEEILS